LAVPLHGVGIAEVVIGSLDFGVLLLLLELALEASVVDRRYVEEDR